MGDIDKIMEEVNQAGLDESMALNRILVDMIKHERADRRKTRRVSIICATICMVSMLMFAVVLGVLASGIQIETTTTTEETSQTVEGDSAIINNGEWSQQYGGGE